MGCSFVVFVNSVRVLVLYHRQISFPCLSIIHHVFQRFHFTLCGLLSVLYAHNVYRDTHFKNAAVNTGVGYIGWIVQHIGTDIGGEYQWLTATPRFGHFLRNLSKKFFGTSFFSHYYSASEGAFWQCFGEKEQKNIGREFRPTGSSFILS